MKNVVGVDHSADCLLCTLMDGINSNYFLSFREEFWGKNKIIRKIYILLFFLKKG